MPHQLRPIIHDAPRSPCNVPPCYAILINTASSIEQQRIRNKLHKTNTHSLQPIPCNVPSLDPHFHPCISINSPQSRPPEPTCSLLEKRKKEAFLAVAAPVGEERSPDF